MNQNFNNVENNNTSNDNLTTNYENSSIQEQQKQKNVEICKKIMYYYNRQGY